MFAWVEGGIWAMEGCGRDYITHTPRMPHAEMPMLLPIVVVAALVVDCAAWVLALVPRNFVEERAN